MSVDVFGRIVDGSVVEKAAIDTLVKWSPTYINEVCRQRGRQPGSIPYIKSYTTVNNFDNWEIDRLPCALIISTGVGDRPKKHGSKYKSSFILGIGIVASARSQVDSNALAKLYGAAVRAVFVQNPSLGGVTDAVDWIDERYDDLPAADGRTLATCQSIFSVDVYDVVTALAGPAGPDPKDDPTEDYDPVYIEVADVTIEKVE